MGLSTGFLKTVESVKQTLLYRLPGGGTANAKALAGGRLELWQNWAMACCGSKVPRGAMPSITTFLSHGYGRVVGPPQGEADYRLAMMVGSD
jgi:hypothetical protein